MGAFTSSAAQITDALRQRFGSYDEKTPKLRPSDMVALVGLFSFALPRAIERRARVVRTDHVKDGIAMPELPSGFKLPGAPSGPWSIDATTYVFHSVPLAGTAWRRTPSSGSSSSYEPARDDSYIRNAQLEQIVALREALNGYQRGIDAISEAIRLYPMNQVASRELCDRVMRSVRGLAVDLEVLAENPPTSWSQDVKGALSVALTASEAATVDLANKVGDAAAHAANLAGEVAAAAAGGFFGAANLLTLGAAIAVGYVAIKGVPF